MAAQEGSKTAGFGTPGSIQCSPSVKAAYSIVRRCTGSLGGCVHAWTHLCVMPPSVVPSDPELSHSFSMLT